MVALLIVVFIVVPILELYVFVQVSELIGFLPSLALIMVFAVGGAWLVKREGIGVMRRAQDQLDRGELPAAELVNGLLILVAGGLMLLPGFVTDLLGLVLLVPPTRAMVRLVLLRRFEKRIRAALASPGAVSFGMSSMSSMGTTDDLFAEPPRGGGRSTGRVFTGPATLGRPDVFDVREVDPDGSGAERDPGRPGWEG